MSEIRPQSTQSTGGGETVSPPQNIVILGIGNILLSDEGVGVHVANELAKMDLPPDVTVVEGGTDGFRLLNIITEADRLIVIDAVRGGSEPGSIYRFDVGEVRNCFEHVADAAADELIADPYLKHCTARLRFHIVNILHAL